MLYISVILGYKIKESLCFLYREIEWRGKSSVSVSVSVVFVLRTGTLAKTEALIKKNSLRPPKLKH